MAHAKPRHSFTAKILEEALRFSCTALVVAFAIVTYQAVTSRADEHHEFVRLDVYPAAVSKAPGEEHTMTAAVRVVSPEAAADDYLVIPMPARWEIMEGEGALENCDKQSRCTFVAGPNAGTTRIQATVEFEGEEYSTPATIDVIAPAGGDVQHFADEIPDWGRMYAEYLAERNIMTGYEGAPGELPTFGGSDDVTRAQMLTLLTRVMRHTGLVPEENVCSAEFTDVPEDHFANGAIGLFASQGWIASNPTFGPDESAPRDVTAAFIANSLGDTVLQALDTTIGEALANNYFDDTSLSAHRDAIALVRHAGFMSGQGGQGAGSPIFDPQGRVNRLQAAAIIYRVLRFIEEHGIQDIVGYNPGAECAPSAGDVAEELPEGVDLTVSAIELSPATPAVGEQIIFRFTVQNLGNEDAAPTRTQLNIDKGDDGTWNIGVEPSTPAVPAGESITVEYPFTPNPDPAQAHHIPAGTHRLQLCADFDMGFMNEPVVESNEENNCREMTFTVE